MSWVVLNENNPGHIFLPLGSDAFILKWEDTRFMKGLYTIANGKDESVNGQYTFSFVAFFLNYMYLGAYLEGYAGKRPRSLKENGVQ